MWGKAHGNSASVSLRYADFGLNVKRMHQNTVQFIHIPIRREKFSSSPEKEIMKLASNANNILLFNKFFTKSFSDDCPPSSPNRGIRAKTPELIHQVIHSFGDNSGRAADMFRNRKNRPQDTQDARQTVMMEGPAHFYCVFFFTVMSDKPPRSSFSTDLPAFCRFFPRSEHTRCIREANV